MSGGCNLLQQDGLYEAQARPTSALLHKGSSGSIRGAVAAAATASATGLSLSMLAVGVRAKYFAE